MPHFDRREFLAGVVLSAVVPKSVAGRPTDLLEELTLDHIKAAEAVLGLSWTDADRELMLPDLQERLEELQQMRSVSIDNSVPPAQIFDPRISGVYPDGLTTGMDWSPPKPTSVPTGDDLAYAGVATLAGLIKHKKVSCVDLSKFFMNRLRTLDPKLFAVITMTDDRALKQASGLDKEIAEGAYRGPLHGIPYGAKDLLAAKGYPTTWGAEPYKDQVIDVDASVIQRLDEAGAVLVAKLTLGALAWGDVWYGEKTRNPWNLDQGSSGSSAGPGSAVSAGCVPFAIGSETLGSIVSPSTRNGVTGHRPTYGRVSKGGAMALSWSMDKLGPMTRSALDAALVLDAITGKDEHDYTSIDASFTFDPDKDIGDIRVGFLASAFEGDEYPGQDFDRQVLGALRKSGVTLEPVEWPSEKMMAGLLLSLTAEAASAFDELTTSRGVDSMKRQVQNAWPNTFRHGHFISAVDFIRANRLRTELVKAVNRVFESVDVVVSPSFVGGTLRMTNLTGHPTVCVPSGFDDVEDSSVRKQPRSISFTAGLYQDAHALQIAHHFQTHTSIHLERPAIR